MIPDRDLSMMFSGYPLALRRCLNFKRPSSINLIASPLMKLYFTPGGWHEAKYVNWNKGLDRLVMGFDVQDGIFCISFPFKHCGIEKSGLVL